MKIKLTNVEASAISILSSRPEWDTFKEAMTRLAYKSGLEASKPYSDRREPDMLLGDMRTFNAIGDIDITAVEALGRGK